MGLDVHAVIKYKVVEKPKADDIEDLNQIFQPDDFHDHLGDQLENGMYVDVIECGNGDYHSGYGQHSHFREFLASLVYPCVQIEKPCYSDPDYENKSYQHRFPHVHGMYQKSDLSYQDDFAALIHFSDCEGVICNELCKILDGAFDKHMEKAVLTEWSEKYQSMAKCVKEAAESGGYLDFH